MQRPDLAPLSCVNVECGRNEMDPCAVKTVPWNEGSICISASRIESISWYAFTGGNFPQSG